MKILRRGSKHFETPERGTEKIRWGGGSENLYTLNPKGGGGPAMYEQNCKNFSRLRYKQHSTIAMLLTSWSFLLAKPYGKKHKLLRSGWPAAAPSSRPSESKRRNENLGET